MILLAHSGDLKAERILIGLELIDFGQRLALLKLLQHRNKKASEEMVCTRAAVKKEKPEMRCYETDQSQWSQRSVSP